jgi:hypothetical protein
MDDRRSLEELPLREEGSPSVGSRSTKQGIDSARKSGLNVGLAALPLLYESDPSSTDQNSLMVSI